MTRFMNCRKKAFRLLGADDGGDIIAIMRDALEISGARLILKGISSDIGTGCGRAALK